MIKKNDIITLEITDISSDGNGVGKYENIAVFVPMTAVGDVCKVKILKVLSSYCFGKTEEIITPSPDRTENKCPNFAKCGGCDFLHISYEAEKTAKRNFVKSCFERIGKIDVPVNGTLSCDKIHRYRNKAQFPVRKDENGKAITGFFAQRSHRIIPCNDCLLQPELLNEIAEYIVDRLNQLGIKAYDEEKFTGLIRHIYFRYGEVTDQLMVCLVSTRRKVWKIDVLVKDLTEKYPMIKTVVLNINDKNTNVILGEENIMLFGDGNIQDILCGVKITLSPHSFYQVNREGAEHLYTIAKNALKLTKDDTLLDLYCGAGTIGLSMAKDVKTLVGVEIIPEAIENAKENAKVNKIKNARFICSDAGMAAQMLAGEGFRPSAVVLDPARKGCDENTLNAVLTMAPERIAMISCNPSTAARDCRYLAENGYKVEFIQPFDMFPRTKHCECVVLLVQHASN
ncbi:MAG: 23S rRNA (uracil(1939)-C(5))-methyltransferase RlmD [Oscillospiraceae bacterium]|nr:23S rRNA (uracil(1939)-C(5))-methyltransferase RlmD [Oscillospiraceae bacterium]